MKGSIPTPLGTQLKRGMEMEDKQRLDLAVAVAEWQTAIDQANITDGAEQMTDLLMTEQEMLMKVALAEGYLFYPGHTDLAEGPTLARRYVAEHQSELEVSNQE